MLYVQVDRLRDCLASIGREPSIGELAIIVHHIEHSMQSVSTTTIGIVYNIVHAVCVATCKCIWAYS
jgi:hypothetical protein